MTPDPAHTQPPAAEAEGLTTEYMVQWMRPSHSLSRSYEPAREQSADLTVARNLAASLAASQFVHSVSIWQREATPWREIDDV